MISAHEDLNPKLISEYSDEFELLVVEVETVEKHVRIISGYGPQENLEEEKRLPFFVALEKEIEKAELAGKSIVIEMDANSKLGSKYIPKDPHEITPNGLILSRVIDRHALCVANGLMESVGTITRKRVTRYRTEESVIDIVLISHDMKQLLVSFKVDEDKKHVLTRITKGKHGVKVKESDHNVIQTEFNCRVNNATKKHKNEIYNLKNKDNQKKFKEYTSQNNFLSSVFEGDDDLDKMTERFIKKLDGCIAKNFSKIRLKETKNDVNVELYNQMRKLKEKTDPDSKEELEKVKEAISDAANEKYKIIKNEVDSLKENESLNPNKLWKLKKRLCPNSRDPPAAMLDGKGNLLTSDLAIQERALEVYADRLQGNKIDQELKEFEKESNKLCETRVKLAQLKKTNP